MKETKNKNIILMAVAVCLVVIMLIVYFSTFNVAKGTYGATETTACDSGYKFVNDGYCCKNGYSFVSNGSKCAIYYIYNSEAEAKAVRDEMLVTKDFCGQVEEDSSSGEWSFACTTNAKRWNCSDGQTVDNNGMCVEEMACYEDLNTGGDNGKCKNYIYSCTSITGGCELPTELKCTANDSNYVQNGWSFKNTGGDMVTADHLSKLTEDTTLFARWVKKQAVEEQILILVATLAEILVATLAEILIVIFHLLQVVVLVIIILMLIIIRRLEQYQYL